jgi:acyl-[acyl-carrier-protein]-phospholipid O-acyltransferase/long-chain-fatty-acid--[acyl-carrier-protein] ligase
MSSKRKNWFFLFTSNFWGVLNDNFMKHCIIFIGVAWILPSYLSQSMLISLVSAALIIPYLLLSPLGGRLAVIYSKKKVFLYSKLAEFPIVLLAALGFYLQNVWIALIAVLLMGIQSCLYSPSKYGLIRDVGGEEGLPFGSGVFEAMAFLGILGGTLVASLVADNYSFYFVAGLLLIFALLGYISVGNIKAKELSTENQAPASINPIKFLKESFLFAKKYPYINCGIFGVSIFWLLGGLLQMNLVIHCKETLHTNNTTAGLVMGAAAIGIALGCSFAGRFSNKTINTRMIFIGLAGMTIFLSAIIIFNPPVVVCAVLIFLTAFAGGFFEVPCLALVQKTNIGRKSGDMLAYMNLVTFIFVLLGSVIFSVSTYFSNENSLVVFGVITGICLASLIYFLIRFPQFLKNNI